MTNKSPFYVMEEFISPLQCENIVDSCDFFVPDTDKHGTNIKTIKTNDKVDQIIYNKMRGIIPQLQTYYNFEYKGTERTQIEWYPVNSNQPPLSENSMFLRGKWVRIKPRDFTAILFLSDFNDLIPFDSEYDVYGGKLEFPQHNFGFNPIRGSLIVYPSDPHFINNTSTILVGNLFQARIHISAKDIWMYDSSKFPGNYTTWFK